MALKDKSVKIAGVILAGGRGRRMNYLDKGLVLYQGQPLIRCAINALAPLVDDLMINANRNIEQYRQFGFSIVNDATTDFDGPLAGVLAAIDHTDADILLVMPCDCPLLRTEHLQALVTALITNTVDIAVAVNNNRLQSVFFAVSTQLKPSLSNYLAHNQHKVVNWLMRHKLVQVDFSAESDIFTNLNSMNDVFSLEAKTKDSLLVATATLPTNQALSLVQTPIIPVVNEWIRNNPGTISLGQGMVAYPPPDSVLQVVQRFGVHAEDHYYSSALGMPSLLHAIDAKLLAENAINCQQHAYGVMVTAGSNMAFLNALMAITEPGNEIILPLPYYFNQEMAVRMLHCTPVFVATDTAYQLQIDTLREAITDKTRAIVTVSPNNPTGAVYSEQMLRSVNTLCRERGLYHISDEAYEYFIYDDAKHFSPGSIAGAQSYTISLYSMSKAYGFASWRIGYMVIPEALLPGLLKIQDTNLICPPLITQHAALAALQTGACYCKDQLQHFSRMRYYVITQLQALHDLCDVPITYGGFYVLLRLKTNRKDLDIAQALIEKFKVAVIPGCAFGLVDGCYLRLSYGMLDHAKAEVALQRLVAGIKALC